MTRGYTFSSLKHAMTKGRSKRYGQMVFQSRWVSHKILHIGYIISKNTLWGIYHIESRVLKQYIFFTFVPNKSTSKRIIFYLAIYFRISYTQMFESFSKMIFMQFLTVRLMRKAYEKFSIGPNIFLERRWTFKTWILQAAKGIYPQL